MLLGHDFSILELLLSGLRLSTPLLFATYGGLLSERSGVVNIALEGFLLVGAFSAAAFTYSTGSVWLGLLACLFFGALIGAAFAALTVGLRGDHVIMGTALNLFVLGAIPLAGKIWFGSSGSTPSLEMDQRLSVWGFFAFAVILAPVLYFVLYKTRFGLRLRASGESIETTKSLGVSVRAMRFKAVMLSGVVTALGGAFLSIAHGSQYSRNMSAGRGFIALAALILAGWRPIPILAICFLFGIADAAQIIFQSTVLPNGSTLPVQWIQMFPYLLTLIVLVAFVGRTEAPADDGKNA